MCHLGDNAALEDKYRLARTLQDPLTLFVDGVRGGLAGQVHPRSMA
eukprot:CAMPEP_0203905612 /NCGR_PEP_ID=MMETSP0359-20131031/47325_1 /ASSEMBLY_ACC=CAM_ASM_000338 /TAXON_ID=268821 /ORGANISM="Scrippsiella Hangoei, Strain SHTV-5" /LENGTH=45 /DNA_ID= /DNA_START= /DNA_END= /DNA_ORIENTATION=